MTKEPQYAPMLGKQYEDQAKFGLMSGQVWTDDPRRLSFVLARYKFVAKMLSGKKNVLEIGCADAFASRIVKQEVARLKAVDFDPIFIENAKAGMCKKWPIELEVVDMLKGPLEEAFEAAYAIDVIEHIDSTFEDIFIRNIVNSLSPEGCLILGCPSLQSQSYASPQSKQGHVNCKTGETMFKLVSKFFHNVFIFSMNDEVVHTGFYPMANYIFAIGATQK